MTQLRDETDSAASKGGRSPLLSFFIAILFFLAFAVVALSVVFGANWILALDGGVSRFALSIRGECVIPFAAVTRAGGTVASVAVACVATGLLLAQGFRRDAVFIGGGFASGMAVAYGIKLIVERLRPAGINLIDLPSSYAFPSGHSFASLLLMGMVTVLLWEMFANYPRRRGIRATLVVTVALLVIAIGFSRIYLGVHWPSDVLGGWCLGGAWLALCVYVRTCAPSACLVVHDYSAKASSNLSG